jgi:hypothetical protein
MALAPASLLEDLLGRPAEITEVIGQKDTRKESRSAGPATHSKGYFVVDSEVESRGKNAADCKDIHVGGENEIAFELRAEVGVAAGGVDVEVFGNRRVNREIESHGKTDRVETGAKVGRGRREAEMQGPGLGCGGHAGCGWFM